MQNIGTCVQQSEVARIRRLIQLEYEAAWLALDGYAEVAQHQFITRRMECMGELVEELCQHAERSEAMSILAEVMDSQV